MAEEDDGYIDDENFENFDDDLAEQQQQPSNYNDDVDSNYIEGLARKAAVAEARNAEFGQAMSTLNAARTDGNFLHHQISTDELLEKLEHFYRGDYKAIDKGDIMWKKQTNKELITFNEFGVTSIMEIVSKYIDRNTVLSSYTEDRIYQIIGDIGNDLILFILCNYKQIGMDTYFKKTKFRVIITTTAHLIENCYRRAIGAKTLIELNQSRVVGQFQNVPYGMNSRQQQPVKRSNPIQRLLGFN